MSRCPLSYDEVPDRYDSTALRRLHPRLNDLKPLPYSSKQLREEASTRADKLSIQGVQPKLSARLNVKEEVFELVDRHGRFILKPQHPDYGAVPENEDLTMKFAALSGIEVPDHGLVPNIDGEFTYWIRRFDRTGRNDKLSVEDFAQLSGESRDTKYRSSMEKVASVLQRFTTFPQIEGAKLFRVLLFCFLCGNEDQHLKNFSLIHLKGKVQLTPFYDLLSTTLLLRHPKDELALTLKGKKSRFKLEEDFSSYAHDNLRLPEAVVESVMQDLATGLSAWPQLLKRSFLPPPIVNKYGPLVEKRSARLGFRRAILTPNILKRLKIPFRVQSPRDYPAFVREIERQRHDQELFLTSRQIEKLAFFSEQTGEFPSVCRHIFSLLEPLPG